MELEPEELREVFLSWLNGQARRLRKENREAICEVERTSSEIRALIRVAEKIKFDPKGNEHLDIQMLQHEVYRDPDEDDRLVERAGELIEEAYKKDKYAGRDVSGFMAVMFERIGDDMLAKFKSRGGA